jgi:GxxExxY protein
MFGTFLRLGKIKAMSKPEYNHITNRIIEAAIEVHRELGAGLLESVYEHCLFHELRQKGLKVETQKHLPIWYKGKVLDKHFYMDMVVNDIIVLELKAVDTIAPIHEVQLMTYLRLSGYKLGLLINFNVPMLTQGIRRKINGHL